MENKPLKRDRLRRENPEQECSLRGVSAASGNLRARKDTWEIQRLQLRSQKEERSTGMHGKKGCVRDRNNFRDVGTKQ